MPRSAAATGSCDTLLEDGRQRLEYGALASLVRRPEIKLLDARGLLGEDVLLEFERQQVAEIGSPPSGWIDGQRARAGPDVEVEPSHRGMQVQAQRGHQDERVS